MSFFLGVKKRLRELYIMPVKQKVIFLFMKRSFIYFIINFNRNNNK